MARKPWSKAKIARVEQQAQALGDLQNFIVQSRLFPLFVVIAAVLAAGLLIGGIEHSF